MRVHNSTPFYVAHPIITVAACYITAVMVGLTIATQSEICDPYAGSSLDYNPTYGPNESRDNSIYRLACKTGFGAALPAFVLLATSCIVYIANRRFTHN